MKYRPYLFLFFIIFFALSSSYAAEMKYGSLNIFSKTPGAKIYVDGEIKGGDSVQLKEVQAGTHFIKVMSAAPAGGQGEATTQEVTIFAEIIEVEPGEVTTIYISEKGAEETKKKRSEAEEVDVFKTKRVLDYSKEMHTGWYLKIEYLTNLYYNHENPTLDHYASSFGLGLGFKIPIAPNIDFTLELERASFSSATSMWFFQPLTANIQLSYLPSPYFRGKQYYGLGIGYYTTDIENADKQNLSAMGYHLFYGLEMPSGDVNAIFFEFGYHVADISRYNYSLNAAYASVGYRWDIKDKE